MPRRTHSPAQAARQRRHLAVSLGGTGVALFLGLLLGAFLAPADVWSVDYGEAKQNQLDPNYAAYLKVIAGQAAPSALGLPRVAARSDRAADTWADEPETAREEAVEWADAGEAEGLAVYAEAEPPPERTVAWSAEPQPPPVPLPSSW